MTRFYILKHAQNFDAHNIIRIRKNEKNQEIFSLQLFGTLVTL